MKAFGCRACGSPLYFENSVCVTCGSAVGYSRRERAIVPLDPEGRYRDADGLWWQICCRLDEIGCTWLTAVPGGQCEACDLTRTRPPAGWETQWRAAEVAKRHLIYELDRLGLSVVSKTVDAEDGLAFDLLAPGPDETVTIGHDRGVITIDLAETDSAYREKVREALDEPYRTLLGHFRHEIGHYYEWHLIRGDRIETCRALFGDESADYAEAVERHYRDGAPAGWESAYISTYATMHPFEDFAETWAHYLHIRDTLESAIAYGFAPVVPVADDAAFATVVSQTWIPLSIALNAVNRSMGRDDLYPFVIPPAVIDKLAYVATLVPA